MAIAEHDQTTAHCGVLDEQVPERLGVFYRGGLAQRGTLAAALAAVLYGASMQPQLSGAAGAGEVVVVAVPEPDHEGQPRCKNKRGPALCRIGWVRSAASARSAKLNTC